MTRSQLLRFVQRQRLGVVSSLADNGAPQGGRTNERFSSTVWPTSSTGAELDRLREVYFAAYPDGRERLAWPGLTRFRIVPTWGRFSDLGASPEPLIVELDLAPGR
jgi:hypothetical protein